MRRRRKIRRFGHARDRAKERYGLEIDIIDYCWLCDQIERAHPSTAKLMVQQRSGASIWLLRVKSKWCVVVWAPRAKEILTFLPLHAEFDDETGKSLRNM